MNICAVVSRNYSDAVSAAVMATENTMLDTCIEGSDRRDAAAAINMQINGRPDIMIVDLSVELAFPYNSIYRVRIGSPDTRIIVIGEDESSPIYTKLVQAGIYDILVVSEPRFLANQIEAAIKSPANFASAVRFISTPAPEEETRRTAPRLTRTHEAVVDTVIEEKAVGTLVVAVGAVQPRSGCTTTAVTIARFLADKALRVALWMANAEHARAIQEAYNDVEVSEHDSRFELDGISFCYGIDIGDIGDYQYVVLDIGFLSPDWLKEFKRASVKILLSGTRDWEIPVLEKFLSTGISNNEPIKSYIYGFVHADKETVDDLKKSMDGMTCVHIPFVSNPFGCTPEFNLIMDVVLGKHLPGVRAQKPAGKGLRFIRKLVGERK